MQQNQLSEAQLMALAALIRGSSKVAAAREAGVTKTSVHRWLKLERVQAAYRRAQAAGLAALAQYSLD